ncbi:hypothetical protein A6A29_40080 [Streptomyces sp. TSRI0281]|nr:hypothetical protein A6A29_40080 [Streptomyces sp. TSRI0281]
MALPSARRQARADARRPRPKSGKIGRNTALRDFIQDGLDRKWSPEQICESLRRTFPDQPQMHVVHETIYQALYVQGRGELRRELAPALCSGRARRRTPPPGGLPSAALHAPDGHDQ